MPGSLSTPLIQAELDRLDDSLGRINDGNAMTLEELDGFFCALICGPELVPPSEYLPHVWGGELIQGRGVKNIEEARDLLTLLARHWNTIATTLPKGDVYVPLVYENESGVVMGNDWAIGFELGMDLRSASWDKLVEDGKHCAVLAPIGLLAREHEPDPEVHGTPLTPERGEQLLFQMALSVRTIYEFFRGKRLRNNRTAPGKRKKGNLGTVQVQKHPQAFS
jgi:uncharacterized protein